MVESVIKCYALYLFLPCATRPNGSGHPERCGNAARKGQNFHAELCPLFISPEIIGSRLDNGAASVFSGALGERHGGLQHALHCFYGARPPDLSLRGGRRFAVANRRRFCYNGQEKGAFAMLDVCDPRVIRALLEKYGFHFSKAKGQNFLTQRWVPQRIAQEAGIDRSTGVLEIGPGFGPLTQELCLRAGRVTAIELDTTLRPVLAETVGEFDNLTIHFADAMKMDLPALVQAEFPGLTPAACANLPYYITSPVLTRLLESRCFSAVTVMVQKEVARRICAAPGTADYSAFSILCQYHAAPELLFDVPASCFIPQPKVTSAVVCLRTRPAPADIRDEVLFFRTVRASFAQRRKTLVNGLASGFPQLTKAELTDVLAACGLPANVRGETLGLEGFAALSNAIGERL